MKHSYLSYRSWLMAFGFFCVIMASGYKSVACSVTPTVTYTCTGSGKDGIVTLNFTGSSPFVVTFLGNQTLNVTTSSMVFSGLGAGTYSYSVVDKSLCTSSGTVTVARNTLPSARVASSKTVCYASGSVALGANGVTGNTYSWSSSPSGFNGTSPNPSINPTSTATYIMTETNPNGCSKSNSLTITVNPIPTVSLGAMTNVICVSGNTIALDGQPGGGLYSGDGVSDSTFYPVYAGVGNHTITYTYTDYIGCSNSATTVISVNPVPNVAIKTPHAAICIDGGQFGLTGTPTGGIFTGDGISDSTFDPIKAGLGSHTISYFYTNGNGCSFMENITLTVNPLPIVVLKPVTICLNNGKTDLGATPKGGLYGGDGISNGIFDPVTAGVGTHTINYAYTDSNGCSNAASATITVNDIPNISFSSIAPVCINAGTFTLNLGSPSGGAYSGDAVSSGSFNPSTGAGNHIVSYKFTATNGCSNSGTTAVTVAPLPVLTFASKSVCISSGSFTLSASPSGGTYTGKGVSGNTFSPSSAGVGSTDVTYSYTDKNGCSNSITASITVNGLPSVSINSYTPVCLNGGSFTLSGSPSGGTFSGNGVSGGVFDPSKAGAGTTVVTYTYTDGNGCPNSANTSIVVNGLPKAIIASIAPVCIGSGKVTLSGSPSGGTYSGDGVSGNTFDPAAAGTGAHTITYWYTDANGCAAASSATTSVTVNALPSVSFSLQSSICINNGSITLSGSPSGGTFSGSGVSGSAFNPATAGAGTQTITYTYKDGNGCSNSATANITVNALPVLSISSVTSTCTSCGKVALSGTPSGGTFSGTGVSGTTFDPSVSGAGTFTVKYSYTDGNGCSNATTTSIVVSSAVSVSIGSHVPVCVNASSFTLTGSPSGGTFSGNGVSGSTFNPSKASTGNNTITYTYGSNSATTVIVVNAVPTVTLASHAAVCINASSFSLSGSPSGGTYSGDGISSNTFNPSNAGAGSHLITYTFSDANSCSASATTTITVTALPKATISATGSTSFCDGGSVVLTAASGDSYYWSNSNGPILGATKQSFTATKTSTYYVTVTTNGCSNTSTGTIVSVNSAPEASAGDDVTYNYGYDDCPELTGSSNVSGSSYLWNTGETSKTITVCPSTTTTYWFTVSKNGCSSGKDYISVYVKDVHCNNKKDKDKDKKCNMCHYNSGKKRWEQIVVNKSDVEDHKKSGDKFDDCDDYGSNNPLNGGNSIIVYPNPFTSTTIVAVTFANDQQVSVELLSIDGKLVQNIYNGNVSSNTPYNYTVDGSNMVPGIYFVRIVGGDHVDYQKINLVR